MTRGISIATLVELLLFQQIYITVLKSATVQVLVSKSVEAVLRPISILLILKEQKT